MTSKWFPPLNTITLCSASDTQPTASQQQYSFNDNVRTWLPLIATPQSTITFLSASLKLGHSHKTNTLAYASPHFHDAYCSIYAPHVAIMLTDHKRWMNKSLHSNPSFNASCFVYIYEWLFLFWIRSISPPIRRKSTIMPGEYLVFR